MAQVDNRFAEANKLFDKFKAPSRRTKTAQDAEKEEQAKKDKIE